MRDALRAKRRNEARKIAMLTGNKLRDVWPQYVLDGVNYRPTTGLL